MKNILSVHGVSKIFNNNKVLNNNSFNIKEGEIVGLVGRNGAGKTTLMKGILGLVNLNTGTVSYLGDEKYINNSKLMDSLGYLIDCKFYEDLNAADNITIQWLYSGRKNDQQMSQKIDEVLSFVGLENNSKRVSEYSFGMKQRLRLALALIGEPKLLILDEPFVGLDPIGIKTFKEYLSKLTKDKKLAVLMSSHQLSEIENLCTRYLYLENGRIMEYEGYKTKEIKFSFYSTNKDNLAFLIKKYQEDISIINNQIILHQSNSYSYNDLFYDFLELGIEIQSIDLEINSINELFEKDELTNG